MNRSDPKDHKKWLKDAEFPASEEAGAEKVLAALWENPQARGSIEPPPGYENRLLAALNARLPEVPAAKVLSTAKSTRQAQGFWSLFGLGQVAWGLAGVAIAALVFTTGNHVVPMSSSGDGDLLVKTARNNPKAVTEWLASIGGSKPMTVASADLHLDLSAQDPKAVEEALKKVAREMGMNH